MPSTTTYEPGVVVVVRVPFTGQAGAKLRPAVVVSTAPFHRKLPDIIVCPVSSQPRYFKRPGVGDLPLLHWRTAGLRHPSTARISNLLAVEKRIIKRALGRLHAEDLASVQQALRRAFGL
jgi:mRNA-degrading endonuclease toxin of MazEF toxin-antitoxin module